jgi:glycine dehydrogenase
MTFKEKFSQRHIGPSPEEEGAMLDFLSLSSIDELIERTIPSSILNTKSLDIGDGLSEVELLKELKTIADKNQVFTSLIGMGYYGTILPPVIQRNILENPGWYTAYTPYQAEISQGRLEALLNFQTMVSDLTALPIANASLLDEASAAAEAMIMLFRVSKKRNIFLAASNCHPQTLDVLQTRAEPLGIEVKIEDPETFSFDDTVFGCLLQYPATDGFITDYTGLCKGANSAGVPVAVASDLLALTLIKPPGEFGADICIGSSQRFGVPMGFGGPHAAFMACSEKLKRNLPGRIIGLSVDRHGNPALRMAIQTREQHIRREKATSNICTSQVLLAVMAGMYAVYHGPNGLKKIAKRIHSLTNTLATSLENAGVTLIHQEYFDTLKIKVGENFLRKANKNELNIRDYGDGYAGISLDETSTENTITDIAKLVNADIKSNGKPAIPTQLIRESTFLSHPVFNSHQSETEMLRYIHRLETKDLALNVSMIPLGSCTMKLNATTQMASITWPEFSHLHPYAPDEQTKGYLELFSLLENFLGKITGLPAVSLQPNSGAQGEFAGLMVIRAFHRSIGEGHRNICLIPSSAHGTNPASAVLSGMEVVVVGCDKHGNIDVDDLKVKAEEHSEHLAAFMVTYPSTHGVFEDNIQVICETIHDNGGQVYLDGANLNAMVGLCRLSDLGADVCHVNLHKTFAIPHGGGGPGMGPICAANHLAEFLPGHSQGKIGTKKSIHAVSSAPWGSAGILPISWAYISLLGDDGLKQSSEIAILNANYMAKRLEKYYPILYRGKTGFCGHEFIIDLRPLKNDAGITDEDVAKRLMDYGFHAPTMSFPVAGTLMIEPTESESKEELDRFCDAMLSIRKEIEEIASGNCDVNDNVLQNAPHTARHISSNEWDHPYSREKAAYPAPWQREFKFWPSVGRVDNAHGDRNLVCTCPLVDAYED